MSPLDFIKQTPKEPVKVPLKVEPKEEVIPAEKPRPDQPEKKEMTNFVIHSEIDAMVLDRQKSQPKTLDEIDNEIVLNVTEGRHQLSLPMELEPYKAKYAFTWIFKRKQAIDEACDLYHYKFTNRIYFPELPDHLFSARGIMERGDMLLMFRPKAIDEQMRRAPGLDSVERLKSREKAHDGHPDFYVPKPEGEETKVIGV